MDAHGRKKPRWRLRVVIALLGAALTYNYWPPGPTPIKISRETTFIDGPVNPDGTINYVAYLDARSAEGVTAENNAFPLLLQACGADLLAQGSLGETPIRVDVPPGFFDNVTPLVPWKERRRTRPPDANAATEDETEEHACDEPMLGEVIDALLAGRPADPDLDAWLADNAAALERLREATTRTRFHAPLVPTSDPPTMTDLCVRHQVPLMWAVEALAVRALVRAPRSDPRGAWDDAMALHRLARLIDQYPAMTTHLLAMGTERLAARVGTNLASRGCLPPGGAKALLDELSALRPVGHIVDVLDTQERFFVLDAVMIVSRSVEPGPSFPGNVSSAGGLAVDWNRILRDMNGWYDQIVEAYRRPRFDGRQAGLNAIDERAKQLGARVPGRARALLLPLGGRLTRPGRTAAVADLIAAVMIPTCWTGYDMQDRARMSHEIETLAVALACYRMEKGRWPDGLAELCPSPLETIPPDRFSLDPLHYRATDNGYLLYSVGPNLIDENGTPRPTDLAPRSGHNPDDIVARVDEAPATAPAPKE